MKQFVVFALVGVICLAISIEAKSVPLNLKTDQILASLSREKRTPSDRAKLLTTLGGVPANSGGETTEKPRPVPPKRPDGLPAGDDYEDFENEENETDQGHNATTPA